MILELTRQFPGETRDPIPVTVNMDLATYAEPRIDGKGAVIFLSNGDPIDVVNSHAEVTAKWLGAK